MRIILKYPSNYNQLKVFSNNFATKTTKIQILKTSLRLRLRLWLQQPDVVEVHLARTTG